MAQYGVYRVEGELVLDVQTDLLSGLNVRSVVPLMPPGRAPSPARRLNPRFVLDGQGLLMVTQYIAALPEPVLGRQIDELSDQADQITAALDMLFHGF